MMLILACTETNMRQDLILCLKLEPCPVDLMDNASLYSETTTAVREALVLGVSGSWLTD